MRQLIGSVSPILYSFRRCPYAIRARISIIARSRQVEICEVLLKNKPPAMLDASPKGTVPVLVFPDGRVIDQSIDIMHWALDTEDWLDDFALELININDGRFKKNLDGYKYAERHPLPQLVYRCECETFLSQLDHILSQRPFLSGAHFGPIDWAIFPFIRQFAAVDKDWFAQNPYLALQQWLSFGLNSDLFLKAMLSERHGKRPK